MISKSRTGSFLEVLSAAAEVQPVAIEREEEKSLVWAITSVLVVIVLVWLKLETIFDGLKEEGLMEEKETRGGFGLKRDAIKIG